MKFANYALAEEGLLSGYGFAVGLPTGDDQEGIGSDNIWELEPFLDIGFKRGPWDLVGFTRFGIPPNQEPDQELETEFHYDVAALYHLHPRIRGCSS